MRRIILHNYFPTRDVLRASSAWSDVIFSTSAKSYEVASANAKEQYRLRNAIEKTERERNYKKVDELKEVLAYVIREGEKRHQNMPVHGVMVNTSRSRDMESSTTRALAKARELDPLKYHVGIKSIVLAPDKDRWNAHYDFNKDQILLQAKFEKKDFQDKCQTLLHEFGHRGQSVDPKTYKAFKDQGLGSVQDFLDMCNKVHREDYAKNGIDNPAEEAFAESYARFALKLAMPPRIRAFWTKRVKQNA